MVVKYQQIYFKREAVLRFYDEKYHVIFFHPHSLFIQQCEGYYNVEVNTAISEGKAASIVEWFCWKWLFFVG